MCIRDRPRPADTGGAKKPARTGKITGDTPVKEHIENIEKNGSKEAPKPTGVQKLKEKVAKKAQIKADRKMPTLQEEVEDKNWNWETPQKHSTPKSEGARKEVKEAVGIVHTPGGSKIELVEKEKQGLPEPPQGPKPGGGTGSPSYLKRQGEQLEIGEPEHQTQAQEKTDKEVENASSWANEPWTNVPVEKDAEDATQEEVEKKKREADLREGGGIRGEAGRLWAEKARGQQRKGSQKDMSEEKCYRCGRLGHSFYKCDYTRHSLGYGLWWGEGDCYHCGQQHRVVKCPKLRGRCWGCGERGHAKDDCPLKDELLWEERICKLCNAIEHVQDDCPLRLKQTQVFQRRTVIQPEARMEGGENPEPPSTAERIPKRHVKRKMLQMWKIRTQLLQV